MNLSCMNATFNKTTIENNMTDGVAQAINKNATVSFYVVFLLLAFLIILANLVVLTLYFKTRSLHTSNNLLLISLAFTDLLAGVINIPLIASSALVSSYHKNLIALNFTVNVISDFIVTVNELNLFLIFFDRYFVICHPLYSRKVITKKLRLRGITSTWVISSIVAIMPLSWCFKVVSGQKYTNKYYSSMLVLISYHSIAVSVCCFILPSFAMLFFLVSMIRSLRMQKKKRKERLKIGKDDSNFRAYHKAFCMLSAMYVSMLIAWSPLMIVRLCIDLSIKITVSQSALDCFMLVRFVTALVNPFVYTFVKKEFRAAFFMTFGFLKCC